MRDMAYYAPQPPAHDPLRPSALLFGASGLVGGELLRLLLRLPDYARVHAVTRRPLTLEHPRLANRIMAFEKMDGAFKDGARCRDAYCCIGTTRRSAGSDAAFRRVDVDVVLACARAALGAGTQRFIVVSSAGADVASGNFYLRVKGEMEEALSRMKFDSLDIMQPGLLLGSRRELRPLELGAQLVMPLVNPFLTGKRASLRGIPARDVASAMVVAARHAATATRPRVPGPKIES